MSKRCSVILIIITMLLTNLPVNADDFGCKVLICLASPRDPKEFKECIHTINKLTRRLLKGKPFPICKFSEGGGEDQPEMNVSKGYERFYPCKSGYSIVQGTKEVGKDDDHDVIVYKCQKLIGYTKDHGEKGSEEYPVYTEYNAIEREEPYWIEVIVDDAPQGARFWYKKEKG